MGKESQYPIMPNPISPCTDVTVTPVYDFLSDPGYYLKVSVYFLKNGNYSPTAKVLYQLFCDLANRYKEVWPSQTTLCGWLGRSEKPFRAARNELIDAGLLTRIRRGQGITDQYIVHPIPLINNYNTQNVERLSTEGDNSRSGSAVGTDYVESEFKKHVYKTQNQNFGKKKADNLIAGCMKTKFVPGWEKKSGKWVEIPVNPMR